MKKTDTAETSTVAMPQMEMRAMETIQPYWRNPRKNADAVPAVKASIERYGMNQPLVVDTKGVIIVGHTRYRALLELGIEQVPVVVMDAPAQRIKEYRIADNKTGEIAKWDSEALIPELRDVDLGAMHLFFPDVDLAKLVNDSAGGGYTPVQQEQVDKIMDRQKAGIMRQTIGATIKIECIHCGEQMEMRRDDIENHGGER